VTDESVSAVKKIVQKNGEISVSKLANELGIDIDTVLERLDKMKKGEQDNPDIHIEYKKSIPVEKEKSIGLLELIEGGESSTLEFKSSMIVPLQDDIDITLWKEKLKNATIQEEKIKLEDKIRKREIMIREEVPFAIIKTIAAFLNSEGGILLVGIRDDGKIGGIEPDFNSFSEKKNWDGWSQHLVNLIKDKIGKEFVQYVDVYRIQHENMTVAKIVVEKSQRPAYVKKKDTEFYVRSINTSNLLNIREATNYILDHWKRSNYS